MGGPGAAPFAPLLGCAAAAAAGLLAMALAPGIMGAIIGYGVFGTANAIFLSLHSAQNLRVLPAPPGAGAIWACST
jgi:multidrug efflux pump subunit AcrB